MATMLRYVNAYTAACCAAIYASATLAGGADRASRAPRKLPAIVPAVDPGQGALVVFEFQAVFVQRVLFVIGAQHVVRAFGGLPRRGVHLCAPLITAQGAAAQPSLA